MSLSKFLLNNKISSESLAEIKKRIYIVGKFNTSTPGVSEFLFKKNAPGDERFDNRIGNLTYDSFIKNIQPRLSEVIKPVDVINNEKLPYFVLSATLDPQNSYVIDPYNYFDVRASSNSEQPYYKDKKPQFSRPDFLNSSKFELPNQEVYNNLWGKEIFRQIRQNLKSFCSFQTRNFELLKAFTTLLYESAGRNGVPEGFMKDSELPVNFLPVFIDFLYQEKPIDETFKEKLKLIDFTSTKIWSSLSVDEVKRKQFFNFITELLRVFKSYLTAPSSVPSQAIGGFDVKQHLKPEKGIIPEELRIQYVSAMEAYNMLTQIVKSKVLLSMVLRWSLTYLEDGIDEIKNLEVSEKYEAIEDALIYGKYGLKKPSRGLPGNYTAIQLVTDFKKGFRYFLLYVANPAANQRYFDAFSLPIQEIAVLTLKDDQKRQTIERLMSSSVAPEQRESLINALLNIFTDVILPKLYKSPGLDKEGLIKRFKEYENDLFFTSAIMDVIGDNEVEQEIEKQLNSEDSQGEIAAGILKTVLGVLMKPKVEENIARSAVTLGNISTIRALTNNIITGDSKNISLGIGTVAPIGTTNYKLKRQEENIYKTETKKTVGLLDFKSLDKRPNIVPLLETIADGNAGSHNRIGEGSVGEVETEIKKEQINLALLLRESIQAGTLMENQAQVEKIINEDAIRYNQSLCKIYERYASASNLPTIKGKIEAFTLTWFLLMNKDELHLGELGSNLYELLIDMVEKVDPNLLDLKSFFAEKSLTDYYNSNLFNNAGEDPGSGFNSLLTVLRNQAQDSLRNVVYYVSELKGIRYLFEFLNEYADDTEVILLNSYHNEFLMWLKTEPSTGFHFLNPMSLSNQGKLNHNAQKFPGLILMTDLAFTNNGWTSVTDEKKSFLEQLLVNQQNVSQLMGASVKIIPPICIPTSLYNSKDSKSWQDEGAQLELLSQHIICPVTIVGPPLSLNKPSDHVFPTVLSAGYVFGAHVLSNGKDQKLVSSVSGNPVGRFRIVGLGNTSLNNAIAHFIKATGGNNSDYSFAGDYYLYLISLVAAAAKYSDNSEAGITWPDFYKYFHYDSFNANYDTSSVLNKCLIYNDMTQWGLSKKLYDKINNISDSNNDNKDNSNRNNDLKETQIILEPKTTSKTLDQAQWFINLVEVLKLKK